MGGSRVIRNIGVLATPRGFGAARGRAMGEVVFIEDALVVARDGIVEFAGPAAAPQGRAAAEAALADGAEALDAGGRACVPGFVDSHTHFVFAGYRADEFFWRAEGTPYMEIHRRGGGIRRSVEATRSASLEDLVTIGEKRLSVMLGLGITTVESKSGYGLDFDTELRQLEAMEILAGRSPIDIVPTFLGAHSIPPEYSGKPGAFIDYLIGSVLPVVASRRLARFADIFCEDGVFGIGDSRRYLAAARSLGLGLKIHADEIVRLGGAGLAAEMGAVSADHLLKASPEDLDLMARAGTIATLLPLTAFSLRESYADARGIIDRGLALALGSDLNPGSCYSQSIPLMFALAVLQMRMSFAETLTALTLNGAAALGLAASHGSLETGKVADLLILDTDDPTHLAYHTGMNLVAMTVKRGEVVYRA